MKFYKCNKSILKWKEMKQIDYAWKLPILIDLENNVIVGNCLKDSLPDNIIVVRMDGNLREPLFNALCDIETCLADENNKERLDQLQGKIKEYILATRTPVYEYEPLFHCREDRCITPELYIEPPPYNFNKHGNSKLDEIINDGNLLSEEFYQFFESVKKSKEEDIQVDLEILKELL